MANGPGGDDDAPIAYLFRSGNSDLYAVTLDQFGSNLPTGEGLQRWRQVQQFALGVHEAVPFASAPEPIIRAIEADGYFLWRDVYKNNPHGTSQEGQRRVPRGMDSVLV